MYAWSMGNKKNNLHHRNNCCHVYRKSVYLYTEAHAIDSPAAKSKGSRIINLHKLLQYMSQFTVHATHCGGTVILAGEVWEGLASVPSTHCSTRGHTVTLQSAERVKGPNGYYQCESNLAAVWGRCQLVEVTATLKKPWASWTFHM